MFIAYGMPAVTVKTKMFMYCTLRLTGTVNINIHVLYIRYNITEK